LPARAWTARRSTPSLTGRAAPGHFDGKDDLLLAVLDTWTGRAARQIASDFTTATTIRERLAAVWSNFWRQRDAVTLLHELWLRAGRDDPAVKRALASRHAESRRAMADAFTRWSEEAGVPLPMPPAALATNVFALLLGLEMQRRLDPAAVPDDVAIEGFLALFEAPLEAPLEAPPKDAPKDAPNEEPKEARHAHADL
jgi:AcrR family transcriptional regulator